MFKKMMVMGAMLATLTLGASQLMADKSEMSNIQPCDSGQEACCKSIYSSAPLTLCLSVYSGVKCFYSDGNRIDFVCQ